MRYRIKVYLLLHLIIFMIRGRFMGATLFHTMESNIVKSHCSLAQKLSGWHGFLRQSAGAIC